MHVTWMSVMARGICLSAGSVDFDRSDNGASTLGLSNIGFRQHQSSLLYRRHWKTLTLNFQPLCFVTYLEPETDAIVTSSCHLHS